MQSSAPFQDDYDSQNKARQSRRKGRRESYTRFSPSEQQNLLDGVARYGAGNWKKILSSYSFHSKRTAVDLKDKYRNILRAQERARNATQRSASSHTPNSSSRQDFPNPARTRGVERVPARGDMPQTIRTVIASCRTFPLLQSLRCRRRTALALALLRLRHTTEIRLISPL